MSWKRLPNETDTNVFFKRTRKKAFVVHTRDDGEECKVLLSFLQNDLYPNDDNYFSKYRDNNTKALFTHNVCVSVCVKRQEWVLWQQVTVFTLNVNIFRNATSKIKGKRKRKRNV